jgi:hypothetical protein
MNAMRATAPARANPVMELADFPAPLLKTMTAGVVVVAGVAVCVTGGGVAVVVVMVGV